MAAAKQQNRSTAAQLDELPGSFLTSVCQTLDPASRLALAQCSSGCLQNVASGCKARLEVLVHEYRQWQPPQPWGVPRLLARLTQPYQQVRLHLHSCNFCELCKGSRGAAQPSPIACDLAQLLRVLSDGDSGAVPNTARVVKLVLGGFSEQLPQLLTAHFAKAFANVSHLSLHVPNTLSAALAVTTATSTVTFPNLTKLCIYRSPSPNEAHNIAPARDVYENSWPSSEQLRTMLPNITSLELRDTTQPPLLIPAWSDQLTSLVLSCEGLHAACVAHPVAAQISTCRNLQQLSVEHYGYDSILQQGATAVDPHMSTWPDTLQNLTVLRMQESQLLDIEIELLLQLPRLESVEVASVVIQKDLSSKLCRWKQFRMLDVLVSLLSLSRLPLSSLQSLHIGCIINDHGFVQLQLPDLPFPQCKAAMQKLAQQLQHVGMSFNCKTLSYAMGSEDADNMAGVVSDMSDMQLAELTTMLAPCVPKGCETLELVNMQVGPSLLQAMVSHHGASVGRLALVECEIEGHSDEFWASVLAFPHLHTVQLEHSMCQGLDIHAPHNEELVDTPLYVTCLDEMKQACAAIKRQLAALRRHQPAAEQLPSGNPQVPSAVEHQVAEGTQLPRAEGSVAGRGDGSSDGHGVRIEEVTGQGDQASDAGQVQGNGSDPQQQCADDAAQLVAEDRQAAQQSTAVDMECNSCEELRGEGEGVAHAGTEEAQGEGEEVTPADRQHMHVKGQCGRRLTVSLFPPPFQGEVVKEECVGNEDHDDNMYRLSADVLFDSELGDNSLQLRFEPC